jgi:hypothetical protein
MDNYKFYLKDLTENTTINLNEIKKYSFAATEGTVKNRFVITIENITTGIEDIIYSEKPFNIYASFGMLNIEILNDDWNGKTGSVKVVDLTGRTIINSGNNEFNKASLVQLPLGNIKGIFMVEITSQPLRHTTRVVVR